MPVLHPAVPHPMHLRGSSRVVAAIYFPCPPLSLGRLQTILQHVDLSIGSRFPVPGRRTHLPCPSLLQAVLRHVDWSVIKCLVIGGPGFTKDQFKEYLFAGKKKQDTKREGKEGLRARENGRSIPYAPAEACVPVRAGGAARRVPAAARRDPRAACLLTCPFLPCLLPTPWQRRSAARRASCCSTAARLCWLPRPPRTSTPSRKCSRQQESQRKSRSAAGSPSGAAGHGQRGPRMRAELDHARPCARIAAPGPAGHQGCARGARPVGVHGHAGARPSARFLRTRARARGARTGSHPGEWGGGLAAPPGCWRARRLAARGPGAGLARAWRGPGCASGVGVGGAGGFAARCPALMSTLRGFSRPDTVLARRRPRPPCPPPPTHPPPPHHTHTTPPIHCSWHADAAHLGQPVSDERREQAEALRAHGGGSGGG